MLVKGAPSYAEAGLGDEQVAKEPWGFEESQSPEGVVMEEANVAEVQTHFGEGSLEVLETGIQED